LLDKGHNGQRMDMDFARLMRLRNPQIFKYLAPVSPDMLG